MQELAPKAWQYGILGVVALAFAYAIIHLFRALREDSAARIADAQAHDQERVEAAVREQKLRNELITKETELRAEYERKHREALDQHTQIARAERRENREHEDRLRAEYAKMMEEVRDDANKSSDALIEVLQKFYERFVGPARGRY